MYCQNQKLFTIQTYKIYMLSDQIQLQSDKELHVIFFNQFNPLIRWEIENDLSVSSFQIKICQKWKKFSIDKQQGFVLKMFLNGKVCFQGINSHYQISKFISCKNSCSIVKMRSLHDQELVMCKIYKIYKQEVLQEFFNEVNALQHLQHNNIVKLKEYYCEEYHNYILFDLIEGLTLQELIKQQKLEYHKIILILRELLITIKYIQSQNYICRNIKLENIYYQSFTDQIMLFNFNQTINLMDYGLSKMFQSFESNQSKTTKDYTDLFSSCRQINENFDLFDYSIVFIQLLSQTIIDILPEKNNIEKLNELLLLLDNKDQADFVAKFLFEQQYNEFISFDSVLSQFDQLFL